MPVMLPPETLNPAGRVFPGAKAHVYGVVPPDAVSGSLYATPSVAIANEVVVAVSGCAPTAIVKDFVTDCAVPEVESVTRTTKLKIPGAVGVPLKAPLAPKLRPVGKVPDARLQV